jgi:hypothetical protein
MQHNSVYLYPNTLSVYLNLSSAWVRERYRNVYNKNLKIYRGSDNRIDLQVKNSDQKSISYVGYIPVLVLTNEENKQAFKKDAVIVDASIGRAYVTITQEELWDIDPGFYNYSLIFEARTSVEDDYLVTETKPGFMDSQYGASAVLEILENVQGKVTASTETKNFLKTSPATVGEDEDTFYTSSLIDARYEVSYAQSNHTFVYYMNNFTGNVRLEASLSESSDPSEWSEISSFDFTDQGIYYHNIVGKWRWFRIIHTPQAGTVDKVLYR